jgi:hypothetical protein
MPQVYKLNEVDWVVAETFEEAVIWYMKNSGLSREEAVDGSYFPFEVKDLSTFNVTVERYGNEEFEKEYLDDEYDNTISIPANVLLEREWKGTPYILCSTEE